jgi:hypothetical protein
MQALTENSQLLVSLKRCFSPVPGKVVLIGSLIPASKLGLGVHKPIAIASPSPLPEAVLPLTTTGLAYLDATKAILGPAQNG